MSNCISLQALIFGETPLTMTIRLAFLLALALYCFNPLAAQLELEGLWEGSITVGGIHSTQGFPMQMYIERKGRQITGRTYIFIDEGRTIEMNIKGQMYQDLSVYIDEIEFIPQNPDDKLPDFLRKYQLVWVRGLQASSLNGYWQEERPEVFANERERGKVFLRKVLDNKA